MRAHRVSFVARSANPIATGSARKALVGAALCLALAVAAGGCGGGSGGSTDASPSFVAHVQKTRVDGTKIAWYERGQGTPLLMLMGTGSTMAEWDPALLRLLARNHRLIMFDYPGLGLSGKWHGNSFDSLAHTAAGLMDAIGIDRVDVLGWSMGGFVAQRLAIDHPEKVTTLILAGTNPGGSRSVLGTKKAQRIDSKPNPSDDDILHELYPPDRQAEGHRFLHRLVTAARAARFRTTFTSRRPPRTPRSPPRTPGSEATGITGSCATSTRPRSRPQDVRTRSCRPSTSGGSPARFRGRSSRCSPEHMPSCSRAETRSREPSTNSQDPTADGRSPS